MHSFNPLAPAAQRWTPAPLAALDAALATALTGLGVGHTLLTPVFTRQQPRLQQLWFAGAGLALVFLGLLNLARARTADSTVRGLCQVANPLGTLYLGLLVRDLPEPQAYAALGLSAALTGLSLRPGEAGSQPPGQLTTPGTTLPEALPTAEAAAAGADRQAGRCAHRTAR